MTLQNHTIYGLKSNLQNITKHVCMYLTTFLTLWEEEAAEMVASALSLTCNFSSYSHPLTSSKTTPSSSYTLRRHTQNPNYSTNQSFICAALDNNSNNNYNHQRSSSFQKKFLEPLLVATTSLALSFTLFLTDVNSASAFVVTTPRKLQTDELATVRLFQENTPSVVYITNLAVKYFLFLYLFLC